MEENQTSVTEFILLGFPLGPRVQMLLFGLFCLFYAFTSLGNGVILGLISLDPRLHTPMYFFLSHLAIVDVAYTCSTVPWMLVNLWSPTTPISFAGCITQTFFFLTFAHTECLLLVVMSYDRYMAICHPLRYSVIVSWRLCITLAITSWACGSLLALVHVSLILRLPFCGPHEINHFFCELLSVLRLACADTWLNQVVILAASLLVLVGPLCLVLVSYVHIFCCPEDPVRGGPQKAFSTCSSHLCVVGLFFGSAMVTYMAPKSSHPEEQQKVLFLFYSIFNPMLNPLIYSLRNAEVKGALQRVLCKESHS